MSAVPTVAARPAWRLENVCVRRGSRQVLQNINLEIDATKCLALIGPNGAGKSSLLLTLLGILTPESGLVHYGQRAQQRLSPRERAEIAAFVPQTIQHIPSQRVGDLVAAARYRHIGPLRPLGAGDKIAVDEALRECGIEDLAPRRFDKISGGERQKAMIAAAIAQDAQMLLLDEPTLNLDPAAQIAVVAILRRWLQRDRGIVVVSHDLNLPAALGGRVVALRNGDVVADGPVDAILTAQRLDEIFAARFETLTTPDGERVIMPRWSRT